jgi:hypothetical protein
MMENKAKECVHTQLYEAQDDKLDITEEKQHFIIVGYEFGTGLTEGSLHKTVDIVCDCLHPDNTVDPRIEKLITKSELQELLDNQFMKKDGDHYIANPLLIYCVDDKYFLAAERDVAQIKAAKHYYGINR